MFFCQFGWTEHLMAQYASDKVLDSVWNPLSDGIRVEFMGLAKTEAWKMAVLTSFSSFLAFLHKLLLSLSTWQKQVTDAFESGHSDQTHFPLDVVRQHIVQTKHIKTLTLMLLQEIYVITVGICVHVVFAHDPPWTSACGCSAACTDDEVHSSCRIRYLSCRHGWSLREPHLCHAAWGPPLLKWHFNTFKYTIKPPMCIVVTQDSHDMSRMNWSTKLWSVKLYMFLLPACCATSVKVPSPLFLKRKLGPYSLSQNTSEKVWLTMGPTTTPRPPAQTEKERGRKVSDE